MFSDSSDTVLIANPCTPVRFRYSPPLNIDTLTGIAKAVRCAFECVTERSFNPLLFCAAGSCLASTAGDGDIECRSLSSERREKVYATGCKIPKIAYSRVRRYGRRKEEVR